MKPAKIRGLEDGVVPTNKEPTLSNPGGIRTAPRNKRHADAWAGTDSPNGKQLEARNWSGAGDHFVQHIFAPQRVSFVSCWQPVEGFVEQRPLFVSKHAAIGLPPASFPVRVPRAASMEGPLCRAMCGTRGWMKFPNLVTSITLFHTTKQS